MTPEAYKMLAKRQDSYWWHRARRFLASFLLKKYGLKNGCRWIDLGCGPGGNLGLLKNFDPSLIVGGDLSPIALVEAKNHRNGAILVRMDINESFPFRDGTFDVATIFNVLYHSWVKDENPVLSEVFRILAPGGLLLITEPAFPVLFREMDEIAMGNKRYRLKEIKVLSKKSGFSVLFESYFTSFGFPLLLGNKILQKIKGKEENKGFVQAADMKSFNSSANQLFYQAGKAEARLLLNGLTMPVGTTLITVLRKPKPR